MKLGLAKGPGLSRRKRAPSPVPINTAPQTLIIIGDSLAAAASSINTDNGNIISAITKANPGKVTKASHGLTTADKVFMWGVQGMTQVNENSFDITVVNSTNFTLGVDTTGYSTYSSGGRAYKTNGAVYNHPAQGFISGLNMLSGQRYDFRHRFNRGIGGNTAADVKNRIANDIPASLGATVIVIVIAANSLNADKTALEIMADIDAAIASCKAVNPNAVFVLSTAGPWDSRTTAQKDECDTLNAMIRVKSGVIVWDWYNEVTDLPTRTWKSGYCADGGHPGPAAGFIASLKLDAALAPYFGRNAFTLNPGNLLLNPGMSGTGGVLGSNTTGQIADNWTSNTGTANGTKTLSKNGSGKQVMAVVIPSGATTGERLSIGQQVTSGLVVGNKYVAEMEIRVDNFSGTGIWYEMSLNLRNQSQAWGTDYSKRNNDSLAVTEMIAASASRTFIMRTPRIEFLSGWTSLGPRLDMIFKCDTGNVNAQATVLNSQLYAV